MIRNLLLAAVLMGQAPADDSLNDILRSAENPLMKVIRGDKPARIMDAQAGKSDAERDLKKGEVVIFRYDMPIPRTGNLHDWNARFERFRIIERSSIYPKIYCDAYNKVIDEALERRFGDSYKTERAKLLPPTDAQPYHIKREGEQPGAVQSATQPAEKEPPKDQPSPPKSKVSPR